FRCRSRPAATCPTAARRSSTPRTASTSTAWSRGWRCWPRRSNSSRPTPTSRATVERRPEPPNPRALPMRLLVTLDPLPSIKTYKDSTYAMLVEAAARGHELFVCEQHELSLARGHTLARVTPLRLTDTTGSGAPWYEAGEPRSEPVAAFGAVLMRKDPPFDMEYVFSTYLLEHAVLGGARVFNDPAAIRSHNEKLSIAEFPEFAAPTLVTRSPGELRAFVDEHDEAVFKLLDGMGGTSVFRAKRGDPNLSVIIETLNQFGTRSVMAQR